MDGHTVHCVSCPESRRDRLRLRPSPWALEPQLRVSTQDWGRMPGMFTPRPQGGSAVGALCVLTTLPHVGTCSFTGESSGA